MNKKSLKDLASNYMQSDAIKSWLTKHLKMKDIKFVWEEADSRGYSNRVSINKIEIDMSCINFIIQFEDDTLIEIWNSEWAGMQRLQGIKS